MSWSSNNHHPPAPTWGRGTCGAGFSGFGARAAIVAAVAVTFLGTVAPVAAPLAAQTHRVNTSWRATDPVGELEVVDGAIHLALDQAISVALARNLGLRIERFRRGQALFDVLGNYGIYDLQASANSFLNSETSPSASVLEGAAVRKSEVQGTNLRVDQLVRTGGTASLNWTNQRLKTNSSFSQINPSFTVGFDALFSQPLMRDLGELATERRLRVARLNSQISLESLELAITGTIQNVEIAFWGLVETLAQLRVAQQSLELAEQLHQMNTIQVEVGTKAPLELIQSEVGIAIRQEEIIRAGAAVQDAADRLRQLLNVEDERLWTLDIVPTTDPKTARVAIDLEQALRDAIEKRPEVANQQLAIQSREIDALFLRNQLKPRLDLDVRYGFNGLGGDVLVLAPGASPFDPNAESTKVPGGYTDALRQVVEAKFEGWQVGLNFAMPLQNRAAKAAAVIADLALEENRAGLDDLALAVRTEVRQTARAVETAAQQIDSAGKSRELAEKNLDAEQKRYENGLSTSFQVLQIQDDLSQARSREVSAITGYRRALTSYYKAIGRLLEESGVEIQDDTETDNLRP